MVLARAPSFGCILASSFTMFALKAVVAAALALYASAAPSKLHTVQKFAGPVKANSYIVTLKADVNKDELLAGRPELASAVTHPEWDARLLNGFAGVFTAEQLNALRASEHVASIVQDGIYTTQATEYVWVPWLCIVIFVLMFLSQDQRSLGSWSSDLEQHAQRLGHRADVHLRLR